MICASSFLRTTPHSTDSSALRGQSFENPGDETVYTVTWLLHEGVFQRSTQKTRAKGRFFSKTEKFPERSPNREPSIKQVYYVISEETILAGWSG